MNIAVLGGGNGAHLMAASLTLKGHNVNMFEMPRFKEQIAELLDTREIKILKDKDTAKLHLVTVLGLSPPPILLWTRLRT